MYLLLNSHHDTGLLTLARIAKNQGLTIGDEISVISYNDAPINEIILDGLTAVSTDFRQMGETAARLFISGQQVLYGTGSTLAVPEYDAAAEAMTSRSLCLPLPVGQDRSISRSCRVNAGSRKPEL